MKKGTNKYSLCKWDGKKTRDICGYENICLTESNYGYEKDRKALKCKKHIKDGMINVKVKNENSILCEDDSIKHENDISFDDIPELPKSERKNKKEERKKDTQYKRIKKGQKVFSLCKWDGKEIRDICNYKDICLNQPSFGYEENNKVKRCSQHREDIMVDVVHKKCNFPKCKKQCNFGYEETGIAQRCGKHREDMVDVIHKKCNHPDGCVIQCVFGYELDGIVQRCGEHREDMVDVRSTICNHESGCKIHPCFGYEEDGIAQKCGEHREENMVDVKSTLCNHESGCKIHPCFGYEEDGKVQRCNEHKEDMVNVKNKKCNHKSGCKIIPSFGYKEDKIKQRCFEHKEKYMIGHTHKKCANCEITCSVNKFCNRCFRKLYPDDPNVRYCRAIELYFHENLFIKLFPNIQNNKKIPGGKSLRRPDWLILLSTHNIILECDENAHKAYSMADEDVRTGELFEDSRKPIIIIRFNPHKYFDNNVKYSNCFKFDDMNKIIVNNEEFERRSKMIQEELIKAHEVPTLNKTIIKLFMN
jgi:hypothetical protein